MAPDRRECHTYVTREEVHALAHAAGERNGRGALVLVLAYCGLRWGEAAGLEVRDLDMLRRRISVERNAVEVGSTIHVGTPKTHEHRSVPFPKFLTERLARLCEGKGPESPLFAGPDGRHLRRSRHTTRTSHGGWFEHAVTRAGLPPLTPHELRHTAASLAVAAGANVKAVQRMLGRASAAMTLVVYADLFDDDLDAVATALDQAASRTVVGRKWAGAQPE